MSAATDLQATINRFAGTVGFTPLKVDGVIGTLTATALYSVLGWISTDTSLMLSMQLKDNIPQIKTSAPGLTIYLNQNAEGLPPAMVAITTQPRVGAAATAFTQPVNILKNENAISAGLLGLGLPDWAVYTGGLGLVAVIGMMIAKRKKKTGKLSGVDGKQNAYGLTFYRWWRAAGFSSASKVPAKARDAWYRGEDPSDWRAEQQWQR